MAQHKRDEDKKRRRKKRLEKRARAAGHGASRRSMNLARSSERSNGTLPSPSRSAGQAGATRAWHVRTW